MRINRLVLLVPVFCLARPLPACLNEMKPDLQPEVHLDGSYTMVETTPGRFGRILDLAREEGEKSKWQLKLKNREEWLKASPDDIRFRNDYGVALAHLGRAAEAIPIWLKIENEEPGLYQIAANLGTGYELIGKNAEAQRWIAEGIRRNPGDHQGSEWLHLRILKAKLALEKNSDWLKTNHVFPAMFGEEIVPKSNEIWKIEELPKSIDLSQVRLAVEYQLKERLQFVNPPDPVVADLMFDLGNLYAMQTNLTDARDAYWGAKEYGYPKTNLFVARDQYFEKLIRQAKLRREKPNPKEKPKHDGQIALIFGVLLTLLTIGAWLLIRMRLRKRRESAQLFLVTLVSLVVFSLSVPISSCSI